MSNEEIIQEVGGWRRKSARILALEEREKERRKSSKASANNTNNIHSSKGQANLTDTDRSFQYQQLQCLGETMEPSPLSPLKRGRKQKRLEDLEVPCLEQSKSQQNGEASKGGNSSIRSDQQLTGSSIMPERRLLGTALDIMQRRDTINIFAQPVDPQEVENYFSIIKEPMDFGTMRTKLQEGKYTSLGQYEHDMFLIFKNAMHFNSSTTIYYKEARAMRGLAEEVLHTLRTVPDKLESEFSLTRGRPVRKCSRARQTRGSRTRTPRPTGVRVGVGPKDGRDSALPKGETSPPVYRPWISFCSESEKLVSSACYINKTLTEDEEDGGSRYKYKYSLLRYAKGLGSAAKKIAAEQLLECLSQAPTSSQSAQRHPLPAPSVSRKSASRNAQSPITSLQTSTRTPNFLQGRNTVLDLNVQASPNVLMPPPKEPIFSQARQGSLLGKRPMWDNNVANPSTNFNIFAGSSKENRTNPSDYTKPNFYGRTYIRKKAVLPRQVAVNQAGQCWLASHLKVIPVEDPDSPNGKKFMTVDMMEDNPPDSGEMSANWRSRLKGFVQRGNTFLNSFNLFPSPSESSDSSARGMPNHSDRWLNLMNTKYSGSMRQTNQSSEGFGIDKNTIAALQGLLTHDFTPLPLWNELGNDRQRAGTSADRCGRVGTRKERLRLKDTDHEPNLSLQL